MKKTIICGVVLLSGFYASAQKVDASGMEVGKTTDQTQTAAANQMNTLPPSNVNADGLALDQVTISTQTEDILVSDQITDADGNIVNAAVNGETYQMNSKTEIVPATENYDYRKNGSKPVDYSNGNKEVYQRKSNENTPVDYSNGMPETYRRDPKQVNETHTIATVNAIQKKEVSNRQSDAELNKQNPNRNSNANAIVPASGNNNGVADKDRKVQNNQANTFQPAASKSKNQQTDVELNNMKK